MQLHSSKKSFFNGTHRTVNPEATKRMLLKKIKDSGLPVYGKVFKIGAFNKVEVPVYAVTRSGVDIFRKSELPSWGKGLADDLALVSGLMERVERFTASDVTARKKELVYSDLYGIQGLGAISRWDFVPCNLQRKLYSKKEIDSQKRLWVRCYSLSKKQETFVPANLVFLTSQRCRDDFSNSTGLATGNSIEEALLHALCEIIECHLEDVVSWNKVKVPTIDIESIGDRQLRELLVRIVNDEGLEVRLNYFTGSFKIPAIRIFAYPRNPPYLGNFSFYTALGVHPDKHVALARAITELMQARAATLFLLKHGHPKINMLMRMPHDIHAFFDDVIDFEKQIPFRAIESYNQVDLLEDIKFIMKLLHQKGCEIIAKDLTHPQIGIPAVRVLVTGLQPGILGIGIVKLNDKAARISSHLHYSRYLARNIKTIKLAMH